MTSPLDPVTGIEVPRWRTLRTRRTVLAVARTLTSAIRLLEALECFAGDVRVQVAFTVDESSAFSRGVAEFLTRADVLRVPWPDVEAGAWDLVLTASENIDFGRFTAPVVVLPHGVGFHKYVPDSNGQGSRVSGLVAPEHLRSRRITLAVSHPGQREQLLADRPEAAGRTVDVGDLSFDRLVSGRPLRERYRRRLGVGEGQRLVLLTSTWGEESLIGRRPELPSELLAWLPFDGYRLAAVLHPNVWTFHSPWQIRTWLSKASAAGLLLVPPQDGWQAAVIAADCVIGDHGSVSFYAAALDRPLLLAAPSGSETVPGTPMAALLAEADRLGPVGSARQDVETAVASHRPGRFDRLASEAFSRTGEAFGSLRALLYDRLALPAPVFESVLPAPADPAPEHASVTSFEVHSAYRSGGTVTVERFPAAVRPAQPPPEGSVRHLSAAEHERDRRLTDAASVVCRTEPAPRPEEWAARALDDHPGCVLTAAATAEGCLVAIRGQGTVLATVTGGSVNTVLLATAVYTCLRVGAALDGDVAVTAGDVVVRARLRTVG